MCQAGMVGLSADKPMVGNIWKMYVGESFRVKMSATRMTGTTREKSSAEVQWYRQINETIILMVLKFVFSLDDIIVYQSDGNRLCPYIIYTYKSTLLNSIGPLTLITLSYLYMAVVGDNCVDASSTVFRCRFLSREKSILYNHYLYFCDVFSVGQPIVKAKISQYESVGIIDLYVVWYL